VTDTAETLAYLCCIVEAATPAHRLLARGAVAGIVPGEPLFPVEAAGLVAAVGRVPPEVFGEQALDALLADLPRLAPFAVAHDAAVRALFAAAPAIIPLSFGVVYRGPERVAALLRERAQTFRRALDGVRGREEWGLVVTHDPARIERLVEAESAEVAQLTRAAAAATPGRAYLLERRRAQARATAARALTRQMLGAIVERLTGASVAMRAEEVPQGRPDMTGVAFKGAFLVETARAAAFGAVVEELQREHVPRGLTLALSGPWAPYSFVEERGGAA
jgi:hypothetical protein